MNLHEAIAVARSRPRNPWLNWFVYEWNKEHVICSSSFVRRHPDLHVIYSTKAEFQKDLVLPERKMDLIKDLNARRKNLTGM